MKLSSRIVFNVLFSTVAFSAFGNSKLETLRNAKDWVIGHKKELATNAGSAAAGALLMYLASNEKVKAFASKASIATSNYTKAKYRAFVNYWNNLNKGKKIAAGSVATAGVAAAYIYFDGPGVDKAKTKLGIK